MLPKLVPKVIRSNPIITDATGTLTVDQIRIGNGDVGVPSYYSAKEGIFSGCPKCKAKKSKPKAALPSSPTPPKTN